MLYMGAISNGVPTMATAPITDFSAALVDRLGDIKAQIADLKKVEADLIKRITDAGEDAIDGRFYRATVSEVAERWFSKNQKVTKGYTTVKVVARKA
jgi:hypothetical protein